VFVFYTHAISILTVQYENKQALAETIFCAALTGEIAHVPKHYIVR
jgi:hypothetical protein